MARKIKISSKVIKKSILITLLVALVVGLGVIVVQSFGKDNILSNNTVLNDLDYSDEYRLYLEKQLIIKSHTEKYEDVIAVGDNINDRDMLAEFRSYAMKNGVDFIKELADDTVSSVTELIEKELEKLPESAQKQKIIANLEAVKQGTRDLRF